MDEMKPIHALISLYKGYGLGDSVQLTAVLCHLRKARPHWIIDYQADRGRHTAAAGIARNCFTYDDPPPATMYDIEVTIIMYDIFASWDDRPNTRVSNCLHERFGLPWDAECGRYQVYVNETAFCKAFDLLSGFDLDISRRKSRLVAIHYEGDSAKPKKNLSHEQVAKICTAIRECGRIPLLLDWRNTSPLADGKSILTIGNLPFADEWGRDAQMNCAIISQCEAFIGIDSGPGKCAAVTDTPSLITWTGNHPACFFDPAPNVTHLVPEGYAGLEPSCTDGVIRFFEKNYSVDQYRDDPVDRIKAWLKKTLR